MYKNIYMYILKCVVYICEIYICIYIYVYPEMHIYVKYIYVYPEMHIYVKHIYVYPEMRRVIHFECGMSHFKIRRVIASSINELYDTQQS